MFEELYSATRKIDVCDKKSKTNQKIATTIEELILLKERVIDCIVWYDGKRWQACIDTSILNENETWFSKLENSTILTNYDNKKEIAYFIDDLVYCINVFDDGNLLQLQCPPARHAYVVSQVAAGYFQDKPSECNGLATGSQIVSIHKGISEEKTLICLKKCIELSVNIVNISTRLTLTTAVVEAIKKMVEEHGIIVIHAASNEGPLYSSIPEQCCTVSDEIFIIGSVCTDEMKKKVSSFENANSIKNYSSKGPFMSSGARGIDFVAPGTAITDIPKWYPKKNDVSHGTSFAAPNVAGSIACLLSALKANGISYSPAMIKMALANTAFLPNGANKLEFGYGIIQINDAFEFIKKFHNFLPQKLIVPFSLMNEKHEKGILFVKSDEILTKNYVVNIKPEFDTKWILKCTPNDQNFVSHCNTVSVNNSFNVKIDANLLKEGSINYAEIYGLDSLNPSIGPLFYLPITVICPAHIYKEKIITVKPDPPLHLFIKKQILSDDSVQRCCIKITALNNDKKESAIVFGYLKEECCLGNPNLEIDEHILKFEEKKNFNAVVFDFKHFKEDFFEICFYSLESTSSNYKLEIDFPKVVV
uniref:Peptidase S8/S53 domain-containing protein n=1 Tax=Panagrolaimus sp. ES5 TaxID=591445 RepID=A0AC34GY93_9BILA